MTDTSDGEVDLVERDGIMWRKAKDPALSEGRQPPLDPGVAVVDGVRCDRDVAVTLRDGTTIYVDVYRADDANSGVPALLCWGRSGKRARYAQYITERGVPDGTFSPWTQGEGPDPDYWCRYGYAVVNCDPRGVGNSEGDAYYPGRAEGLDCVDVIEWAGIQPWCTGKVSLAGNSWYAIVQWFAAAEHPPHLACIAPWEGCTDIYRQFLCQGGIPETSFNARIRDRVHGYGLTEDALETVRAHPLINEAWEEKIAHLERINVPAYITASWSHFHLYGSIKAFRDLDTENKWLRIHRDFEWPDFHTASHLEELRSFFDRYLKGHHNGWEMTPRVRLDVMDAGEWDYVIKRPEREFPLARTQYREMYLNAKTGALTEEPTADEAQITYDAQTGSAAFDMKVDERVEITGYLKLRLWVEAIGSDDADIFVTLQKLGVDGNERPTLVLGRPHPGAWGRLRASHRDTDPEKSTPSEPFHPHRNELRLSPGEVVPLDVSIWPTSRVWHKGETLRVLVAGDYVREDDWFEQFAFETRNVGSHVLHTGGPYDSHLLLPVIPRYREVIADARGSL